MSSASLSTEPTKESHVYVAGVLSSNANMSPLMSSRGLEWFQQQYSQADSDCSDLTGGQIVALAPVLKVWSPRDYIQSHLDSSHAQFISELVVHKSRVAFQQKFGHDIPNVCPFGCIWHCLLHQLPFLFLSLFTVLAALFRTSIPRCSPKNPLFLRMFPILAPTQSAQQ